MREVDLHLRVQDQELSLRLAASLTVKRALKAIADARPGLNVANMGLFLSSSRFDDTRLKTSNPSTLRSLRLKKNDIVNVRPIDSAALALRQEGKIMLAVTSVVHGFGSTMSFPLDITVRECKELVFQKLAKTKGSADLGLESTSPPDPKELFLVNANGTLLLDAAPLAFCGLRNLEKCLITDGNFQVKLDGVRVFGVNPSLVPHVNDEGHLVPRPLQFLKNLLRRRRAFDEEGLFRLAGSSEEIAELRTALDTQRGDHYLISRAATDLGHQRSEQHHQAVFQGDARENLRWLRRGGASRSVAQCQCGL